MKNYYKYLKYKYKYNFLSQIGAAIQSVFNAQPPSIGHQAQSTTIRQKRFKQLINNFTDQSQPSQSSQVKSNSKQPSNPQPSPPTKFDNQANHQNKPQNKLQNNYKQRPNQSIHKSQLDTPLQINNYTHPSPSPPTKPLDKSINHEIRPHRQSQKYDKYSNAIQINTNSQKAQQLSQDSHQSLNPTKPDRPVGSLIKYQRPTNTKSKNEQTNKSQPQLRQNTKEELEDKYNKQISSIKSLDRWTNSIAITV